MEGRLVSEDTLREHLVRLLEWHDAHADFDGAVADLPSEARGRTPKGAPYSPWQLLEHLRIAQHDILDFCRNPQYREMDWPDDYWPSSAAPASDADWDGSVAAFRRDRAALQALARDPKIDLSAKIPHGSGQTYLREILLAADHAAYHVGELVLVRRLLGVWTKA
ncbi:MAG: DinB family protein [Betaproteobacteria bacterium]